MNTRDLVADWVNEFGKVIQTPLKLQEDGVCAIGFGEGKVCAIEVPEGEGPIVIHAPLLPLAGKSRESLYAKALALNLFGSGTAGCAIALDEQTDRLVLCVSRGVSSLDSQSFGTLVGGVITTAVRLAEELSECEDNTPESQVPLSGLEAAFSIRV